MAQMCPACSHNNADNASTCAQCRQPLLKLLGQGTLLANRYPVTKVLGCGGMGAVYLAQDQNVPSRLVAIKENLSDSPQAQQQFQSEVSVMVGLRHPGLPSVTDQFTGPLKRQYLVMDYIEGETLEDFVTQRHPLPTAQVIDLGLQLLDVLQYLHSRSIIHRDIKPTNIRLTGDGKAVLVDFGISKRYIPGQPTQIWGRGVGTTGYAPLEQYGVGNVGTDVRTDLYSLGAVLYFTLTAQTPPAALELERGEKPLTPPQKLRTDVSLALQRVIFKSMALPRDRRYQTAQEMRQALTVLLGAPPNTPVTPPAVTPSTPPPAAPLNASGLPPTIRNLSSSPTPQPGPSVWPGAANPVAPAWSVQSPLPLPPQVAASNVMPSANRSPVASCLQLGCVLILIALLMVLLIGSSYFYLRDGQLPRLATILSPSLKSLSLPGQAFATATPISATATPVPPDKVLSASNLDQVMTLRRLGKGEIHCLAWSPNGQWLAVATSVDLFLYTVQGGQLVEQTALGVTQSAESVDFSIQSDQVAVGLADGSLQVYAVASRTLLQSWSGHTDAVLSLAFSPTDNTLLASGGQDHRVQLWQMGNGAPIHTFTEPQGEVVSLAFAPDGQALAAGEQRQSFNLLKGLWEGKVYLWRLADKALLRTLDDDMRRVNGLAFSPDGQTLVTGEAWLSLNLWSGRVRLWRVATGQAERTLGDDATAVEDVTFAPDGKSVATALRNGSVEIRQASDGALLRTQTDARRSVVSVVFAPNGAFLAGGSGNGDLWLWRAVDGALVQTFTDYTQAIHSVAFASDGLLAWGEASIDIKQRNGAVQLWRVPAGSPAGKREDPDEDGDVEAVAFSPDGALVAASGSWGLKLSDPRLDGVVRLWQARDGSLVRTFDGAAGMVKSVAFSPDGKFLAAGEKPPVLRVDGAIHIWSINDSTPVQTLTGFAGAAASVAFSGDGQWLAAGLSDGQVRIWRTTDWALVQTLTQQQGSVQSVTFSPDSQQLAAGAAAQHILLWRVADGSLVNTLDGKTSINSVAFAPHGDLLAAGGEDGVVRLWNVGDGRLLRELPGHQAAVKAVAFSPDGALLVSGSDDRTVRVWGIP